MAVITARPTLAAPLRAAWLLLITLLVLAIAIGGLIAGSRLLNATATIPQGGDALLAFDRWTATSTRPMRTEPTGASSPMGRHGTPTQPGPRTAPGSPSAGSLRTGPRSRSWTRMAATLRIIYTGPAADTSEGCVPRAPAWSPDGDWLAFTHRQCPSPGSLYVARADGSGTAGRGHEFAESGLRSRPSLRPGHAPPSAARPSPSSASASTAGRGSTWSTSLMAHRWVGRRTPLVSSPESISPASAGSTAMTRPVRTELVAGQGHRRRGRRDEREAGSASTGTTDAFAIAADGSGTDVLAAANPAKEYNPTLGRQTVASWRSSASSSRRNTSTAGRARWRCGSPTPTGRTRDESKGWAPTTPSLRSGRRTALASSATPSTSSTTRSTTTCTSPRSMAAAPS